MIRKLFKEEFIKTIAFDFDGVISTYDGWKGEETFGEPIEENINLMRMYKDDGYKIIIFTTRKFNEAIKQWLNINDVPYDEFVGNKPFYSAFVDDRAINNTFNKDAHETYNQIYNVLNKG